VLINSESFIGKFAIFDRVVNKLVYRVSQPASFVAYFLTGILVLEVVLRYVFKSPTIWAHELATFVFAAYFLWGGAYAVLREAHVNVDIIYNRFSLRTRAIVDLFTWLLFYITVGLLLWKSIELAWVSVRYLEHDLSSVWGPPVWPIKLVVPIVASLMILQRIPKTILDLFVAVTGRKPSIVREVE